MRELVESLEAFDKDASIGCMVVTGDEKSFAAGADIKEMHNTNFSTNYLDGIQDVWTKLTGMKKPVLASVNGLCIGGGLLVAMMCDIVYAGHGAIFVLPEIKIGTIPGTGGTQLLTRAIGKSKSMEMCLTGDLILAEEAASAGLVSKVFPAEEVLAETIKTADVIAGHSHIAVKLCKEATNAAFEMSLSEGLRFETRLAHLSFATEDRYEGMSAFIEKRKPVWKNR